MRDTTYQPTGACSNGESRLLPTDRAALVSNSWFAGLSAACRHDLLRALAVRSYQDGETIFDKEECSQSWMVCLANSVLLCDSARPLKSKILCLLRPGQWFGAPPITAESVHRHAAVAKGASRIGYVGRLEFARLLQDASFALAVLRWQSWRLESVYKLLEGRVHSTAASRVAQQFVRLSRDYGVPNEQGETEICIELQQSELAALAGCSRQRANEAIQRLLKEKVLRFRRRRYAVLNEGDLERRAES
jgi:CRP/FNR family transcriptional regulator, cyclic AMP receptor protein